MTNQRTVFQQLTLLAEEILEREFTDNLAAVSVSSKLLQRGFLTRLSLLHNSFGEGHDCHTLQVFSPNEQHLRGRNTATS
jgi:hypothetical protein